MRSSPFAWAGPAFLVAVFLALVAWSWRKWPDVLIDFGRELYVPWQLAAGKVLYADIAYFNGPLSPWINSVLFRTFGVGLMTLVAANLIVLCLVAAMIYLLVREVSRPFTATVATLVFLTVFSVGQYGSQGMAKRGYAYHDILRRYYGGEIELRALEYANEAPRAADDEADRGASDSD